MTEEIKYDLFKDQHESCRQPLPFKELDKDVPEYVKRALLCDPTEFYERLRFLINPFKRYNFVSFAEMFPDKSDGTCACGCSLLIPKGRRRWATQDCQRFATACWNVVSCRQPDMITWYLNRYYGTLGCINCGESPIDLDHRIPIKQGGGGCWFSNYDFLCVECHAIKTAKENNWLKSKRLKK